MVTAQSVVQGNDRREYFRGRYFGDIEIEWGSANIRTRTADISLGGALVEMPNPLWLGAEFFARFSLGDPEPLEVACVVRQILPGVGMGVEFLDLRPADLSRLRRLLETLPH